MPNTTTKTHPRKRTTTIINNNNNNDKISVYSLVKYFITGFFVN